jgi:hypothetical protein
MAAHANSKERLEEVISRVEDCLRDGYSPPWLQTGRQAVQEAGRRAVADGWVNTYPAFETRLKRARELHREPDWTLYRAPVYQSPTITAATYQEPSHDAMAVVDGQTYKVCCIGDMHDDPRLPDKSRFKAIGRWAADQEPDVLWQAGDWATFDSFSRHTEKGSRESQLAPTWKQDLNSLLQSVEAFEKGFGCKDYQKVMTEGNHELRVAKYENTDPRLYGSLAPQWREIFTERGWRVVDFGEYYFIDSVGFIHHPINGAGKAFGGVTGNQRAAADAVFSIVHGHDHKLEFSSRAKIGPVRPVEIISIGCSLPWGHVEQYAKLGTTGWWWGCVTLTIRGGQIIDKSATSMLTIMEKYG